MNQRLTIPGALLALLALAGCDGPPASTARYELRCNSSNTKQQSQLFCVRHDTTTGDVRRVAIDRLPRSSGPTAAAAGPEGTYQLVCEATSTETRSDFYCVRLNRKTGELLMVALPKLGVIPAE
jgi:hypothetical protein